MDRNVSAVQLITRPAPADTDATGDAGPAVATSYDDPPPERVHEFLDDTGVLPLVAWPVAGRPGLLARARRRLREMVTAVAAAPIRVRWPSPGVVLLGAAGVLTLLAVVGGSLALAGPDQRTTVALPAVPVRDAVAPSAAAAKARPEPKVQAVPARVSATVTGGEQRLVVRVRSSKWVALEWWLYGPAGRVIERRGLQVGPDGWSVRVDDLAPGDYRWRLVPPDGKPVRGVVTVTAPAPSYSPPPGAETTAPPPSGDSGADAPADDPASDPADDPTDPPEPVDPGDVPEPVDPDA